MRMGSTATICTADSKPLRVNVELCGHLQGQGQGAEGDSHSRETRRHSASQAAGVRALRCAAQRPAGLLLQQL